MDRHNYKTHIYFNTSYGLDNLVYVSKNEKEKIIEYVDDISGKITSDNIFDVIYTEEDDDEEEYSYEEVRNIIIDKHKDLCGDIIERNFILQSFNTVHAVVIISKSVNISSESENGKIFGFALISFNEPYNSISIEVMCSNTKGVGRILIGIIEKMCKTLLIPTIYLSAVESAIPFYKKVGFVKYRETCKGMCTMIKTIPIKRKGGKKGKTNKNIRMKIKKTRKNRLYTLEYLHL